MQRRNFVLSGLAASAAAVLPGHFAARQAVGDEPAAPTPPAVPVSERICLFTDHLDDFGYSFADVAKMFVPLKIAGPDLTVRGGGVVNPERVADELPKAADAFREQGLSIPMISTNLTSAGDPTARPMLTAMGKLGIGYFKLGYYHYHDLAQWETELQSQRKALTGLLGLSRQAGVVAGLHNHAGSLGGAIWDGWEFLRPLAAADVGFYFDPAHASIEGAKQAWKLNFRRIAGRLVMVALKDYVWEKSSRGWQTRWCPLGEGMVNWKEFFELLATVSFSGPLSIHIEYDPGGSTRLERIDNCLAAAQRDIGFVRQHLQAA